jgi:hypothetical protein
VSESRAYTAEECCDQLLDLIRAYVNEWARPELKGTTKERLEGLAFSILVIFDSGACLPGFALVPRPHPDDREYLIANDENYYEEIEINADISLHERWHGWGRTR